MVSPEILPDKKVTFRLLAPKAGAVVLNGNWDQGTNIAMTKDDEGIWSVTVGPLGEQLWGYSFSVDGVKVMDPGNGEYQRDGQRYDNLLMITGPASDAWDVQAGHSARGGDGGLVSVDDPEAEGTADVRLHAAGLPHQQRQVSGAVPAARRRR